MTAHPTPHSKSKSLAAISFICLAFIFGGHLSGAVSKPAPDATGDKYQIFTNDNQVVITAGDLKRTIQINRSNVSTTDIHIGDGSLFSGVADELSFRIENA
jgi:hypothetical protein